MAYRKRSQIFGSEEPNLIAIRTKSYRPKNQILLPEELGAFLPSAMYDDYQTHTKDRFSPVVPAKSSVSGANNGRAKIGFL